MITPPQTPFPPTTDRDSRSSMLRRLPLALPVLASLVACQPLPEAPETVDELVVYFYENHPDDDPLVLGAGIDSFVAWLEEHADELDDADYAISPLSEEAVDLLDDEDRTVDGLIGLAVVTTSAHTVDDAAFANTAVSIEEVYGEQYTDYERDVIGDVDCFLDRGCPRLEADERYTAHFPLGLESRSHMYNQYVWGEGEAGTAYLQRNWLVEKPEVNSNLLDVDQQFYMNLLFPKADGGHFRLQATWMIVSQQEVDEDLALNLTANSMRGSSDELEAWMDENL